MKLFKLLLLNITLLLGACANINKSYTAAPLKPVVNAPMNADIFVDTSKKITGYAYGGYLFNLFKLSGDNKYADGITYGADRGGVTISLFGINHVEEVKAMAAYNALQGTGAEILVYPRYVIEESTWNPFWKSVKVKVVGYPGKVVNLK